MEYSYPEGATPLDPDEKEGLVPGHLKLHINILKHYDMLINMTTLNY